jgi:peroxiredoxin
LLTEGELAPDFELEDQTGKRWSLGAALKSGPVLVAFFKIACPTCQLTIPFLQRLADGEGRTTPQLVAISQDDAAATQNFHQRFRVSIRTLIDPAKAFPVSNAYRITHVPSLFLVEPNGRISLAADGFSKAHLQELGRRFGVHIFHPQDRIPVLQPG